MAAPHNLIFPLNLLKLRKEAEERLRWVQGTRKATPSTFSTSLPPEHQARDLGLLPSGPQPFRREHGSRGRGFSVGWRDYAHPAAAPIGFDSAMKTICR